MIPFIAFKFLSIKIPIIILSVANLSILFFLQEIKRRADSNTI